MEIEVGEGVNLWGGFVLRSSGALQSYCITSVSDPSPH